MSYIPAKVGDLCTLVTTNYGIKAYGFNKKQYVVYDVRPQLYDGIWLANGPAKRVGMITSNKDMFVLLELNEANECCYPKILTTDGMVGYLYLHNDNETVERVKQ